MEKEKITRGLAVLGKSFALSMALSACCVLIVPAILLATSAGEHIAVWLTRGIWFLSALAGGIAAGKMGQSRRILWGLGSGFLYFLCLFLVSASLTGTGSTGTVCLAAALSLLGGILGGILS